MSKTSFSHIIAIILAGGKGTRMESDLPKVLHTINNKPLVQHTIEKLLLAGLKEIIVVVGYKENKIREALGDSVSFVSQKEPLGTGHAVLQVLPLLPPETTTIVVLNGDDSAFYKPETLKQVINEHLKSKAMMTILTTEQKDAEVSGRVMRDKNNKIAGIKANSKMSAEELRNNNELVCGLYLFNRKWLEKNLPKVEISPKGEYNITGLIEVAIQEKALQDIKLTDPDEWKSVNTQKELQKAQLLWKQLYG